MCHFNWSPSSIRASPRTSPSIPSGSSCGWVSRPVKDEVRQNRAMELLHRSDRPIKQVAEAAGFVNEKSFIRAFRGWTGHSPAEYRRLTRTAA